MNKMTNTKENKKDLILINKKDFILENKILEPIVGKANNEIYKSFLVIYKLILANTQNPNDWFIYIPKDMYKQYIQAIKNLYLNAWDNCKTKNKELLDVFTKIAFWINTSQSQITPIKGKSRELVIHVKLEDMMNIKNALGAASLFCDNEQFKENAWKFRNVCAEYIENFEKMLENEWNESFKIKPSDMAERIRHELQK